jgi:ribosome-associated protein
MTQLTFELNTATIDLFKLLKALNLVASGGEAKMVIADGMVKLNGELETRKRKKVVAGDIVIFSDTEITITALQ